MTARVQSRAIRQRKLSTKHGLPILRETDVDMSNFDEGAHHNVPKVETGVEKAEETEHHLQQAMAATAGGNVASVAIPTPETVQSQISYDRLYPRHFEQPVTYIRFSSTVEDSIGAPYCMTAEDDMWLKNFNHGKSKHQQCSEDTFEEVMSFFEETAQSKQPFSGVDNPPPLTLDEIEQAFDESMTDLHRHFAKDVYEYWKKLRVARLNNPLLPTLKCEAGLESDETDPYVCFRRRELRQTRKTRNRDAQVTEKLKKLRRELEDARFLVHNVQRREQLRIDQLRIDRDIFDQRSKVKEVKRNLGIKGDDEDLVNQKPSPKPKPPINNATVHRAMQGSGLKPQLTRADGRPPDLDLVSLQETKARKNDEINRFIDESLLRHQNWNKGYVDVTWRPITPPLDSASQQHSFRPAVTEYLPSPPASASDDGDKEKELPTLPMQTQPSNQPPQPLSRPQSAGSMMVYNAQRKAFENNSEITVRYTSPPSENFLAPSSKAPSFRRRVGRGGRLMIDRRGVKRRHEDSTPLDSIDERTLDRYKYDIESEDEDDTIVTDPFDTMSIRYRVALFATPRDAAAQQAARQRALTEGQQVQAQAAAHAQAQSQRAT